MKNIALLAIVAAFLAATFAPAYAQAPTRICLFDPTDQSCQDAGVAQTKRTPTTITSANTFQTIVAAGQKLSITIQNNNTNGDNCWLDFGVGVTAANASEANGILLGQGGSYQRYWPFIPSDEIEATCATGGDHLRVDVQ